MWFNKIPFSRLLSSAEMRRVARRCVAEGKLLDITLDIVFKTLFSADNPDSRDALSSLISACIHRAVSTVKVLNPEILPEYLGGKTVRLDVLAEFNDGERANIEMQVGKSIAELKNRAVIYASRLAAEQIRKGEVYKDAKRSYQIFFLDFILFPKSEVLPRRYAFLEKTEHDQLSDLVEVIFYEIPKLEKKLTSWLNGESGPESLSKEERWCVYFRCRKDEEKRPVVEELCRIEGGIMKAENALKRLSRDEEQWARALFRDKAQMDYKSEIDGAREQGITIGEERGREKGIVIGEERGITIGEKRRTRDIARNLKAQGLSPQQITAVTGLSAKEISQL
jgi:predicted transposase/invertase (TIGR01784 family)